MRLVRPKRGDLVPKVDIGDLPACFEEQSCKKEFSNSYCKHRWECRFGQCNFKNPHNIMIESSFDLWVEFR